MLSFLSPHLRTFGFWAFGGSYKFPCTSLTTLIFPRTPRAVSHQIHGFRLRRASWFLVSMYLIWIFGPMLILSNNQSCATLWILGTCLIVGLLPFTIILITASLSSNTYNKAS